MPPFSGFTPKTLDFLTGLAAHNEKPWFDAHRAEYDEHVLEPARRFVEAMGQRLSTLAPGIQAVPQANGSLFRIHRDTRFSDDKTPYKTNLAVFFWEGTRPRMECSGFYMNLEPGGPLMLGVGIWMFPKELLQPYRDAVVHPVHGPALTRAVEQVRAFAGDGALAAAGCGGTIEAYKKVPPGYPADHPRAELLRLKGLHAGVSSPVPPELMGADLVEWAFSRFAGMAPLHHWLVGALG